MSSLIKGRFRWVNGLRKALDFILEDTVDTTFKVKPSSDPLRATLVIPLKRTLPKNVRQPLRDYIRAWGNTQDCEIPKIDIEKHGVYAQVLFKYRHPHGIEE